MLSSALGPLIAYAGDLEYNPGMSFDTLVEELKRLPAEQVRYDFTNYLEFVIDTRCVKDLCPILESHLGPPLKTAGKEPSQEAKKCTDQLGGIEKNQVLYYLRGGVFSQCAMLWPWEDKNLVTVKVAQSR